MKRILIITLLYIFGNNLYATQQENDIVFYNNEKCELETDFSYPSPLEQYKVKKYEFKMLSTANYRGFIATWRIEGKKMFLEKVEIRDREIRLNEIFDQDLIVNNSVPAEWFTGYLLIKSSPVKMWYDSPYGKEKYYVIVYQKISIIEISQGNVIKESSYDGDDYYKITGAISKYNSLSKDDIDTITNYLGYIGYGRDIITGAVKDTKVYTVDDFDIFLERNYTKNVKIPLTEYCVLKGASVNFNKTSAFIESDLQITNNSNLLILEMGATDVPDGVWSNYTSGSVQVIIGMDSLNVGDVIKYNQNSSVRFINNFGKYQSNKMINYTIEILEARGNSILLKGEIVLESFEPYTFQRIPVETYFPVYSIREYLEYRAVESEGSFFPLNADEVYNKILKKN